MESAAPFKGVFTVDLFECPPFRMFTADDCMASMYILGEKRFEPMSMRIWCRLARAATGILDIGANVGVYSLAAAASRPELTIHAFEPNPYAFARLRLNARLNGFDNLDDHPVALAHEARTGRLAWAEKNGKRIASGATLTRVSYENCETYPCDLMPLDAFSISVGHQGLVKIDVEGAEQVVILVMSKVLAEKPDIIMEIFNEDTCRLIKKRIVPLGYRAYEIDESAMTIRALPELMPANFKSGNSNRLLTVRDIRPEDLGA